MLGSSGSLGLLGPENVHRRSGEGERGPGEESALLTVRRVSHSRCPVPLGPGMQGKRCPIRDYRSLFPRSPTPIEHIG